MKQIKKFSDSRLDSFCVYCGNQPNTRDHVPSKIFIDEPYPENLPVICACSECNQGFSLDEEYIACLIECILVGSTNIKEIKRQKIKRILSQKSTLVERINKAYQENNEGIFFEVEYERLQNVIIKLGKGHAAFENSEPHFEKPFSIWFKPISQMSNREITAFFKTPSESSIFPEVGSRAFQRIFKDYGASIQKSDWLVVQPGRYRYSLTLTNTNLFIRMVLSEYLACVVIW